MVMRRKNPADDILINRYTEGQDDLLGNARASPTAITLLHFNNSTNQIRTWAFRSGFRSVLWGTAAGIFDEPARDGNSTGLTVSLRLPTEPAVLAE